MSEEENISSDLLAQRLRALREEFDASFGRRWETENVRVGSVLCFTVDGLHFAVPLSGLQALSKYRSLVRIPSRSPALLGLVVLHAQAVPVYSLPRLTGAVVPQAEYEWLAVLRGSAAVAFAIETVDGYAERVAGAKPAEMRSPFARGFVKHHEYLYEIVDAAELYQAITQQPSGLEKGIES